MPPIEENDLFVLYRDDNSLRKVTVEQMKEEFGGGVPPTPDGVIDPPVVIISPEDGAGMSNVSVYPAAEGITGVAETAAILFGVLGLPHKIKVWSGLKKDWR